METTLEAIRKLWPDRTPREAITKMMQKVEWRKLEGMEANGYNGTTSIVSFIGEFETIGGTGFTMILDGGVVNVLLWEEEEGGILMSSELNACATEFETPGLDVCFAR